MAYIGNIPAEKFTSVDIQNFTVSATANYTLDRPVANENEIELFINNVRQHPGSGKAYTASGTALTLSEATAGTDTMYCVYQGKARQTVTPATSSVTNDMLAGSIDLTSKVTGALPQANIADQAINEAKMQISNAPTNGYMLTAQSGNTGGLTWAEAPSGGLVHLNTTTGSSNVGTVDIDNVFSSTYANYLIIFDLTLDTNATDPMFRFRDSTPASLSNSAYTQSINGLSQDNSAVSAYTSSIQTQLQVGHGMYNQSNIDMPAMTGFYYVIDPVGTSTTTNILWNFSQRGSNGLLRGFQGNSLFNNQTSVRGYQWYGASGNVHNYTFRTYGIVNS